MATKVVLQQACYYNVAHLQIRFPSRVLREEGIDLTLVAFGNAIGSN